MPACPQKASSCSPSAATTGQNWPRLARVAQGPEVAIVEQGVPRDTCMSPAGVSTMVSRKQWGADAVGCSAQLALPVGFLITHHVPGLECHNQTSCSQRLRELQGHHVRNGWCDIAYK